MQFASPYERFRMFKGNRNLFTPNWKITGQDQSADWEIFVSKFNNEGNFWTIYLETNWVLGEKAENLFFSGLSFYSFCTVGQKFSMFNTFFQIFFHHKDGHFSGICEVFILNC